VWSSFTFFEARGINFANVVYSVFVHVEIDLHLNPTFIAEGKHGQESEEGKEEDRQEEKEVVLADTQYLC